MYNTIKDTELVWTNAYNALSGVVSSAPIVFDVASDDDRSDSTIIQRWQEMWTDIDSNPSKNISVFKYFTFVKSAVAGGSYDYNTQILSSLSVDKTNKHIVSGDWHYYYNEATGKIEAAYND